MERRFNDEAYLAMNRQAVRVIKEADMDTRDELSAVDFFLICVFLALVTVFAAHVTMM